MTEQWKSVPGWDGLYEVSDRGRVRSLDRYMPYGGSRRFHAGRVLSPAVQESGHLHIYLHRSGVSRKAYVHRLVLEAFVGPAPEGMECCHRDDDQSNNALSNLRWDTSSANTYDSIRNGTHWGSHRGRKTEEVSA